MRYISTNCSAPAVSFREAALAGLAPDGGLYLPERLPPLPAHLLELEAGSRPSFPEAAFLIAQPFVGGEIDDETLRTICHEAFSFPVPIVDLGTTGRMGTRVLELFWGPTFAFKDFGARFLARALQHLLGRDSRLTIVVATSGDTGSAVAHGFHGMETIDVVLLYPSGRVSRLQEQQLTTLGGNVTAVEVLGTFDDCQAMAKAMLSDQSIQRRRPLGSANSINFGRLLPQVFYYVAAWREIAEAGADRVCICVPSGNLGNVTGALMATLMGLPVSRLVIGTNANDAVPRYLASGRFVPRAAIRTPASAMDVGNPSNLARALHLCDHDHQRVTDLFRGYSVGTAQILAAIRRVRREHGYLLDPHSAVGYAALQRHLEAEGTGGAVPLLAATAHPGKFGEAILEATGEEVEVPPALAAALAKEKRAIRIGNNAQELRELLLDTA